MARTRERTSSAQPLVAVPSIDELEPASDVALPTARRLYDLTERVLELETRLRERVESERVLDAEVRSLQRDADLRQGYIVDLENRHEDLMRQRDAAMQEAAALGAERERLVGLLEVADARADAEALHRQALEARAAVRLADTAARAAAAHPLALRTGTWVARRMARRIP